EDGIRDRTVTGVQTCALPISRGIFGSHSLRTPTRLAEVRAGSGPAEVCQLFGFSAALPARRKRVVRADTRTDMGSMDNRGPVVRSEERRVGKEWSGEVGRW